MFDEIEKIVVGALGLLFLCLAGIDKILKALKKIKKKIGELRSGK